MGGKGGAAGPDPGDVLNAETAAGHGYGFGSQGLGSEGRYNPQSPWASYWEQGYSRGQQEWQKQQMMDSLSHMMSGGAAAPHVPSGPSYEEQLAAQERLRGEDRRNAMYTEYMDSASMATDYVNAEINKEISNANLLGIKYNMDDAKKQTRIENYFASIWGEGQDAELKALVGEWGEPTGFGGFILNRGDASLAEGVGSPGSEEIVDTTKRPAPGTIIDEEDTLGQGALLGL